MARSKSELVYSVVTESVVMYFDFGDASMKTLK